jgi:hypothetical protein
MFSGKGVFSINNGHLWVQDTPRAIFVCLEMCTDRFEQLLLTTRSPCDNVRHLNVTYILKNERDILQHFPLHS